MASIGIDLGTTATVLAQAFAGFDTDAVEAQIVKTRQKKWVGSETSESEFDYLPSFAYFPKSGEELVGVEAKSLGPHRYELHRCVRAVKRLMGRSFILPDPVNRTPEQISSLYLEFLLAAAHKAGILSGDDELTVTVPASFTTNQRRDTMLALETAASNVGLSLPKTKLGKILISEPVAALLAYLADDLRKAESLRKFNLDRNPIVLVYDMGGGTLDLTLVRLSWQNRSQPKMLGNVRFEVHELNRYNQFAGEDFDRLVAQKILLRLLEVQRGLAELDLTEREGQYLRLHLIEEAERLKIDLNAEIEWSGDDALINFNLRPARLRETDYPLVSWDISANDYLSWTESFLAFREDMQNAVYPVEDLLRKAMLHQRDIDYFLLVGGMARFLPLQSALKNFWGRHDTFLVHPLPEHAVALGAAVYSYLKLNHDNFMIDEPSADAYYVRRSKGFGLLLGRGSHAQGEKEVYELQGEGDKLRLQIFAGEPVPAAGSLESIYSSLVYQGSALIPLGRSYPKGTKVWIQMSYREDDNSKVPFLDVWVDQEQNLVASLSYAELAS